MRYKENLFNRLTKREIELLKKIDVFIIENNEYDYDGIYRISDKTVNKEIELINAEKKGEYNLVADEYWSITNLLIKLGNKLYSQEEENSIIDVYQSETDTYKPMKIIGRYEYLGGIENSDLIKGTIYYRVEPANEFRIVDESKEDYLYDPECFQDIDSREDDF